MNYFCHAILSDQTPIGLAGTIGGDAIKGKVALEILQSHLKLAVREHRHVDELSRDIKFHDWIRDRLPKSLDKFTGIYTDLVFDHVLYKFSNQLLTKTTTAYADEVEEKIQSIEDELPPSLIRELEPIRKYRLILGCEKEENLRSILRGITRRFKRYKPEVSLEHGLDFFQDELKEADEIVWKDFEYLKKGTESFRL